MNDGLKIKRFDGRGMFWLFWFAITIIYWFTTSLLHLKISKIIISSVYTPFGSFTPSELMPDFAWALLFLGVLYVLLRARKGSARLRTFTYWIMLGGAVYAANCLLVLTPNEYAHYPQYALLAVLLAFWQDPHWKKWPIANLVFWGTALGIVDELIQYFFVCPSYGDYLDFNDFLLNQLGVVAGLLLVYGFREQGEKIKPLSSVFKTGAFKTIIICGVLVFVLIATDRLRLTPPKNIPPGGIYTVNGRTVIYLERKPGITGGWNHIADGRVYYVLSPMAGLFLLLGVGFIFASFDPRILRWNRIT